MSRVYCASFSGRASTSREMNFFHKVRSAVKFSLLNCPKYIACSFLSRLENDAALRAKFWDQSAEDITRTNDRRKFCLCSWCPVITYSVCCLAC